MRLTPAIITLVCALSTHSISAVDFQVPAPEAALEALKGVVAETTAKSKDVKVWIKVFGKQQRVGLIKADKESFTISVMGNPMDQKWSKTSKEDIYQVGKGCLQVDVSGALAVADYCFATGQLQGVDEVLTLAAQGKGVAGDAIALRSKALAQIKSAPKAETGAAADGSASGSGDKSPEKSMGAKTDKAAMFKEATDFSIGGYEARLGPDFAFYNKGKSETFPNIYTPPTQEGKKGRNFQIGGPWAAQAGDYSSTQGQVLYVPDSGFGVDRVTVLEMGHNTYSEKPEPPWWGGFRPEPTVQKWMQSAGGNPGTPVGMARGMAAWSNCGVAVFSSGLIATAGTCTAKGNDPVAVLPKNKVPTAISVTNRNEFALITVVDTEKLQGQIAVVALESNSSKTGFAHEWKDANPGLPNVAVFTSIKLLGYVDLPGISVPTSISAVGDAMTNRLNGSDGHQTTLRSFDLSTRAGRQSFYDDGSNSNYCCRAGFAVVASKYENKVAFVDLQPMFERVREMYFTSDENYAKTRDMGPDPKQWPYSFEVDPGFKPVLVQVVDQPRPTAVLAALGGGDKARAFVASQDGRIGIYSLGGLSTTGPVKPNEVKCVGTVQVGRNPVCLAYHKGSHDHFFAVSRGDREIAWVKLKDKGDGAEVIKRLRDAKLIDPVYVEHADTHGTEVGLITVCDFRGRKILNYRWTDIVYATNGGARFPMGPDGKAEFECGGWLEFPGQPFCISATNVN